VALSRTLAAAAVASAATVAAIAAPPATRAAASPGPAPCRSTATPDPRVPAWEAVNGFALGTRPATLQELDRYLARVDAASGRVRVVTAGRSAGGRPLRYALVSAPAALRPRRLAALGRTLRAVVDGTAAADAVERLTRGGRAVVWVAGSVHGNEPSGSDADARLLYELASGRDCAAVRRLARLVVAVMPVQNPDGHVAATRVSGAGFDLNRDWLALAQPESRARMAAVRALPPLAFVDQHEQGGSAAFTPPYADPVHHEVAAWPLRTTDSTFGPAVRRAFATGGWDLARSGGLDLFFPGYADSATTLRFGAAGLTVEVAHDDPFADRVAQQAVAAAAVVDAAATHKAGLVRGWSASAREARAQGARGRLEPNALTREGDAPLRATVPAGPVRGYAIHADRREASAAALVATLRRGGVGVRRLRSAARVARLLPFAGGPARRVRLPAGTFVVSMAQGAKHWVQALLAPEAHVALPALGEVSAWSLPLLGGLEGGAIASRLPAAGTLAAVGRGARGSPLAGGGGAARPSAYALAGDTARALGLAAELLAGGAAVARLPGNGELVVSGVPPTRLRAVAARRSATVRALPGGSHARATALALPRVALLRASPGTTPASTAAPGLQQPSASPAWARFVLRDRLRLGVEELTPEDVAAGRLAAAGHTHLVVPDGAADVSPAGAEAIAAFVRAGGTYVGWRGRGIDVAVAAGITTAQRAVAPETLRLAGAALAVELDATSPLALGTGPTAIVLNEGDPLLRAGDGVVGRYPPRGDALRSGYAEGLGALRGAPAIVDQPAGAGRTILFTFDPAFRAAVEGTELLLANALLGPGRSTGSAAR
jgi:hypothetical protein